MACGAPCLVHSRPVLRPTLNGTGPGNLPDKDHYRIFATREGGRKTCGLPEVRRSKTAAFFAVAAFGLRCRRWCLRPADRLQSWMSCTAVRRNVASGQTNGFGLPATSCPPAGPWPRRRVPLHAAINSSGDHLARDRQDLNGVPLRPRKAAACDRTATTARQQPRANNHTPASAPARACKAAAGEKKPDFPFYRIKNVIR